MEFQNLSDAKALMGEVADLLTAEYPYYDDFSFFRSINCTTQGEYREMLKEFLETFLIRRVSLPPPAQFLYPRLVRLYGWL